MTVRKGKSTILSRVGETYSLEFVEAIGCISAGVLSSHPNLCPSQRLLRIFHTMGSMVRKYLTGVNKEISIKGGCFYQNPIAVNSITCTRSVKPVLKCFAGQRPDGSTLCKTEL